VLGPTKICVLPNVVVDTLIFSDAFSHAPYITPSRRACKSLNDVGAIDLGVTVWVGDGIGVAEGDGIGVAEGVGSADGADVVTLTPLFHTSFLPDLMHLYLIPETVVAALSLLQAAPALTAPDAEITGVKAMIKARITAETDRFIG
jgi:hypothetical protein